MWGFFVVMLIFGVMGLLWAIYLGKKMQKIQKLVEYIDLTYPSLDSNQRKKPLLTSLSQRLQWHFRNVYTQEKGLKLTGVLAVLVSVGVFVGANALFLQFNFLLILCVAVLFGGYIANSLQEKRLRNEFENSFPEALVIISGAISSGNNITQALQSCADTMSGVLADEFKTIVRSLNVGEDPEKIFIQSYARLPFDHYYFFLTSLLVSIKSGARIKEVLSKLSGAVTKAKAMEKKKNAMTSEVRMSSKITAAIPFVFLILMKFISPDNFDYIMYEPNGRYILYYFLISEGIGMGIILFLMRKI
ncbi:hypothetical protein BKH46_05850 [Helicobacter sp. 12S02634-8]|uniref:type II secretion system F family protein n=1 Tax=Helicobacter sp. 12S02634-8 TaxID=1476199 RepID=UPI000BA63755|nr:type II secretion system F family protein [Helicobacter sp. 12S02634-8]PAF46959.1 hypothetical protein BKH46_05850 [Helicobacter sp. 12S02634-8]